jgi:hypothetical protein
MNKLAMGSKLQPGITAKQQRSATIDSIEHRKEGDEGVLLSEAKGAWIGFLLLLLRQTLRHPPLQRRMGCAQDFTTSMTQ